MSYSYSPTCYSSGIASHCGTSTRAVVKALGMEFTEVEGCNCCGSPLYGKASDLEALCFAARNLALIQRSGNDMVTSCSFCYITLNWANATLSRDEELREKVSEVLSAINLSYPGDGVKVRHLLEVLINDTTCDTVSTMVKRRLKGLRVAPYYGPHITSPGYGFDAPESLSFLDQVIEALGGEVVPLSKSKAQWCGDSPLLTCEEERALTSMLKVLEEAETNGAQVIVAPCPLAQTNLDIYQPRINGIYGKGFHLPVLLLTQIMGVAFGISPSSLDMDKNVVSPYKTLSPYLSTWDER